MDGSSFNLLVKNATYQASEELTDDGIMVTETITASVNAGSYPNALLDSYTRYQVLINNCKLVGTSRYPMIKSLSVERGTVSLTLERKSPKI